MLLSLNWLKELTPCEAGVQELADVLTMRGLEIEEIREPFKNIGDVVVGHVLTREPHPQADKLSLCKVDAGDGEPLSIVCGAPNVAAGQKIALAKIGAKLPNGLEIKKAKIRGETSFGMICSESELGLGEGSSGIMVLDAGLKVGEMLADALNLDNVIFGVNVTPNRGDCLSVLGLAREVAAAFGLPITLPEVSFPEEGENAEKLVRIQVDEGKLCPLYQARIISGAAIALAPAKIRYRLQAVGIRSISNVVDVTNYIMMELGQPLHAFDRSLLRKDMIRVARADEGMVFKTLDGQNRVLNANDLLIWDGEKPVALAGVMGGAETEINGSTSDVLLECAIFNPSNIRKTARRLGLSSESSYRFERGVDQVGAVYAVNRAAAMIAGLSGGRLHPGIAKAEPIPAGKRTVPYRPSYTRELLGLNIDDRFCLDTLKALGCKPEGSGDSFTVEVPSYRPDLEREVDLVEEVGRVYGLDRIEAVLAVPGKTLDEAVNRKSPYAFLNRVKSWAEGAGLREVINYSFVGTKDLDMLGVPDEERIPVFNPLSEDWNVMRPLLAPGLLKSLKNNISQGNASFRLFEVAAVFHADASSETTAREETRLGVLLYGSRFPEVWPWPAEEAGFEDLKGLVADFSRLMRVREVRFSPLKAHPFLEPALEIVSDGEVLGFAGRVKAEIADACLANKPVWMCELKLDAVRRRYFSSAVVFRELPKFPPVRRDMTVVAPLEISLEQVMDVLGALKMPLLEEVSLIDVFRPEGRGERNLTLRMTYRHKERTLKDAEVDKEHSKAGESLLRALPVRFP